MNDFVAILMPFLYFPEDKSEYIPAAISFTIFMILMIFTYRWIVNISKKQEAETKELEAKVLKDLQAKKMNEHSS